MKTNVALKAGLDGLRTYKADGRGQSAEAAATHRRLKMELKEAEETIKRHQGSTLARKSSTNAIARAHALEERLNTQAELIQSLETDLKTARRRKAVRRREDEPGRSTSTTSRALTKELEAKGQIIEQLQWPTQEQRKQAREAARQRVGDDALKALTEKDRSEIDALEARSTRCARARSSAKRWHDGRRGRGRGERRTPSSKPSSRSARTP